MSLTLMGIGDFKLYIFDWDGTLSTSTTLVRLTRIFQSRYNVEEVKKHKDKYVVSNLTDMKRIRDYILENEREGRFYSNFYDIYSTFAKPKLREGALEMLKLLRKKGKKVALFSDSKYYRLKKEMEHAKLLKYFDTIVCADLIKEYKPSPKGILMIAREMKVSESRSLYIGDMATDVMTAKFGHMPSCAVGGGLDPYYVLKDARPDYLFKDMHELYKKLQNSI